MTRRAVVGGVLSCWFASWWCHHRQRWRGRGPVSRWHRQHWQRWRARRHHDGGGAFWLSMATTARALQPARAAVPGSRCQDHDGRRGRPHKPPARRCGAQVAPRSVAAVSLEIERLQVLVLKEEYLKANELRRQAGPCFLNKIALMQQICRKYSQKAGSNAAFWLKSAYFAVFARFWAKTMQFLAKNGSFSLHFR